MKLIIPFSLLALLIFSCNDDIKNIQQNSWPNGSPKKMTLKTNTKGSFYILNLDSLGNIVKLTSYTDSLKNGALIHFRPNKEIGALINFKDEKREGNIYEFYPNLIPLFKGFAINGKFNGKSTWYYKNGQVRETGKRIEDKDTGKWEYYKSNGELDTIITK